MAHRVCDTRGTSVCLSLLNGVNTLLQHFPVPLSHQDQVNLQASASIVMPALNFMPG